MSNIDPDLGAWCALLDDVSPFLQVDFKRLKKITRVGTQGRPDATSYVSKYFLSHSLDGAAWTQHDQTFSGNFDGESVVVQRILPSFQSRYVRLHPLAWSQQSCLRVEYYGCNSDGGDEGLLVSLFKPINFLAFLILYRISYFVDIVVFCQKILSFLVSIPFFIDENTGEVNVSDELDRETHEKYVIKVEVR